MDIKEIILIVVLPLFAFIVFAVIFYFLIKTIMKNRRENFTRNSFVEKSVKTISRGELLNQGIRPTKESEENDVKKMTTFLNGNIYQYTRARNGRV